MARRLWIAGLSFALLVYTGWAVFFLTAGLRHRRLNTIGAFLLVADAYIIWYTFQYLLVKIRNQPYVPHPADEQEEPIEIPRLL